MTRGGPTHWAAVAHELLTNLRPANPKEQPVTTDQDVLDAVDDRDFAIRWADQLAEAIATYLGVDIGEHSNDNNPWQNAAEALDRHQRGAAA